jgi:hypothetical protein
MTNDLEKVRGNREMQTPAAPAQNGLTKLSKKLDDFLRFSDLLTRRTAGGWMDTKLKIGRHSGAALLLPSVLCGLLVLGSPTGLRSWIALGVTLLVGFGLIRQMQWSSKRNSPIVYDLLTQAIFVFVVGGAIWIASPDTYCDVRPYRHAFIPLTVAVALALLTGAGLLHPLFKWLLDKSQYAVYLTKTELFASRDETPPFSAGTVIITAVAVAIRAPLALLTLPALAILMAPPAWILPVLGAVGGFYVMALLVAGLNDRFGMMWLLIQESFFKGGALLISLTVIALAAARLAGVTYVTTVFDSAAWWTISIIFASAYVLSWWFDYWSHRVLIDEVLRIIAPGSKGAADIPYSIEATAQHTSVPVQNRRLQIHGSARFLAVYETNQHRYFQAWDPVQLIEILAASGAPGGKAVPNPHQIASRIANYQAITGLVFAVIVGVALWRIHEGYQFAQAVVTTEAGGVSLQQLIKARSNTAGADPLFIVAASGGGTRAAVYTAAILEAIARQGKAENIVLGSGVSGGGAALAYFAGHRQSLIQNAPGAWDRYFKVMTQPYIQDVLQRSSEWSMARGGRLGMLLSESFAERWDLPNGRKTLHDVSDFGLILNTSLAGHFERPPLAPRDLPLYVVEQKYRDMTTSTLAGGRLLLTNLVFPSSLTSRPLEPDASLALLPVVIRSPELKLEDAAALNANFPPVFSNAAIDVDNRTRYWVTDGGVIDNRGMEMMLYAVRAVLASIAEGPLPRLHIVVADASAFSSAFEQDRGVSTMTGAGSRYASHLDAELVEAIRSLYAKANQPDRFNFSYVMMPDILRESGSFGTHWMLQNTIRVRHPGASKSDPTEEVSEKSLTISGEEMVRLIRSMHSAQGDALSAGACEIYAWAAKDIGHGNGWAEVQRAIGASTTLPACLSRR